MTIYELTERDFRRACQNLENALKKPNVPASELKHLKELYRLRKEIFEKCGGIIRPCHWHEDVECVKGRMCGGCEHQPPNEEKKNGKNPPMEFNTWECPACGEPTYSDEVCVFCGQKLIWKGETDG